MNTDTSERKWFSPREAAQRTGFTVRTLYTYMNLGKIAFYKLGSGRGSRIRISEEDLKSFMDDHKYKAFAKEK